MTTTALIPDCNEAPATFQAVVVGAGQIGRSWAITLARAGQTVTLIDVAEAALDRAREYIRNDPSLATAGAIGKINYELNLAASLKSGTLIFECVPESVELKQRLHREMSPHVPGDALVVSSTSGIPGSRFFSETSYKERAMVAHPINPPHLLPLVEVCPTPWTTAGAVEQCLLMFRRIGRAPILVRRETPFFVANRLQAALLGEAIRLFSEGIASAQDIDTAIKHGFGRRLAFLGIFESMQLNTDSMLSDYFRVHDVRAMIEQVVGPVGWTAADVERLAVECERRLPQAQIPAMRAWRDDSLRALSKLIVPESRDRLAP